MRYTSCRRLPGSPSVGAGTNGGTGCRDNILPQRLPWAERGQVSARYRGTWSGWHLELPRSKTPRRGRRDTLAERDLAEAWEPHWRALATVATLEEEIEWLSQSITWCQLATCPCPPPRVGITAEEDPREGTRGTAGCSPSRALSPSLNTALPRGVQDLGRTKRTEPPLLDFNLKALLELGPEIDCFLQELAGSSEEENRDRSSPEPPDERIWEVGDLESLSTQYAWLMAGTGQGPQDRRPPGTSPEGMGFLWTSLPD